MSIRYKLAITILGAFILNLLMTVEYYNIFISPKVSRGFDALQAELNSKTASVAEKMSAQEDYKKYLDEISYSDKLLFRVETLGGEVIYQSDGNLEGSIYMNSISPVKLGDEKYLLIATRPIPIDNASNISPVRELIITELIIILVILLVVMVLMYLKIVGPIEKLQKYMEEYKRGHKPLRTDRRDELGRLQNSFVEIIDAIESEKKKQDRIIASISHDIKTPLTSVLGYAERLTKSSLSDERRIKYLSTIYDKSLTIKELIDEFDDYLSSNIQSSLKKQEVTIGEICSIFEADYRDELESLGVQLTVNSDCGEDVLCIDISELRRVFGNLISNSLKHFNRQDKRISLTCKREKDSVLFMVFDNGIGVPQDKLEQIFEPFYTSDEGRTVAGLGLSICREIIQAHGGRIWAENNEDGGLTVCFTLDVMSGV